jgi:D-tyrosyl-tRNA(Tyr) deacylase
VCKNRLIRLHDLNGLDIIKKLNVYNYMRAIIQRVSEANITINSSTYRSVSKGFLVLLGIEDNDDKDDVTWLVQKIFNMRIFPDEEGKMNKGFNEVNADILIVSQFTLFASTRKGNRPSFIKSAKPTHAIPLYELFISEFRKLVNSHQKVETGEFGADMQIQLINDGPVTIFMDTKLKE